MPAKKIKQEINLLPEVDFEYSTKGRIISWLLGTFRIIVILTELVVVSAFFLRFGLDSKASDLSDEIEQKKSLITSYSVTEKTFRDVQTRIDMYSKNTKTNRMYSVYLSDINKSVPQDIFLTSVTLNEKELTIEGNASTEKAIQLLMANTQSFDYVEAVYITKLEQNKENIALNFFTLKVLLKI